MKYSKLLLLSLCGLMSALPAAPTELHATEVFQFPLRVGSGSAGTIGHWRISQKGVEWEFGPIGVWVKPGSKTPRQLTNSLATLDELCREQTKLTEWKPGTPEFRTFFSRVTYAYGSNVYDIHMDAENAPKYLAYLEKKVDAPTFVRVKGLIVPYQEEIADNKWKHQYTVVTANGGIETRHFRGQVQPFSIQAMEVRLIAPANTVPDFGFLGLP